MNEYSKMQSTIEPFMFAAEFIAVKCDVYIIRDIRYKLMMI